MMPPVLWLYLVFLVLKLCGVIDWSWWWVNAPLIAWFLGNVFEEIAKDKKGY